MKRLGLIGGMSHHSTLLYEQAIHAGVQTALGGNWSADLVVIYLPFEPIKQLQTNGGWNQIGSQLAKAAQQLEQIGAQAIMITSNTVHRQAPDVEAVLTVPLLHITDPTADALAQEKISKVLLLGTRFTMEQDFISGRLNARGIATIIPDADDRAEINRIIFDELCKGVFKPEATALFRSVVDKAASQGAQAVVLGCTEITLVVKPHDLSLPLFDTTALHIGRAITFCLEE